MHDRSDHFNTLRSVRHKKGVCVCEHPMSLLTLSTRNIGLGQ